MSEPVRLYRHYSAAQLDNAFVRVSKKLYLHRLGRLHHRLTDEKVEALERLLVLIDEERDIRI